MNMKILFIALFAVGCVVCDISEGDCLSNYFSNEIQITSLEDTQACDRVIGKYVNKLTGDIMTRLKARDDQTCILNNFHDYKIADLYLKGLEYHLNNHTSQSQFDYAVAESTNLVVMYIRYLCGSDDLLNTYFYGLFYNRNYRPGPGDEHRTLCQEKYFVDHGIIDPVEFNIDPSTLNVKNCEEIIKNLEREFAYDNGSGYIFGLSDEPSQDCTIQDLTAQKFKQNRASLQVIATFELTAGKIERLRLRYVDWMSKALRTTLRCYEKVL